MHTKVSSVKPHTSDPHFDRWHNRPRYAHGFIWADNEPMRVTLAVHTLSAPPLPGPPANELLNSTANHTTTTYPHLFAVVSPVNVDYLEELLATHLNCPFTLSLCAGLCKGFWPWAVTSGVDCPLVMDNLPRPLHDSSHAAFAREQCDLEIFLGCFSHSFGSALLPRMTVVPVSIVPKPHFTKF